MREVKQTAPGKPAISGVMVFSALLSLLMLIVVVLDYAEHPRELGKSWSFEKGTSIFQVGYAVILTASAFVGALLQIRWIGCMHAALLSGVSAYWVVSGVSMLNDNSTLGGSGPDANPVAGVAYGVALGAVALGIFSGCLAVAIWLKVFRRATLTIAE